MRHFVRPFATLLSLSIAVQPLAAAPLTLEPSSDWTLWAREDVCRVVREFGTGDQKVIAQFEKSGPASALSLLLAGNPVAFPDRGRDLEAALGPANQVNTFPFGAVMRGEATGPASLPTLLIGSIEGSIRPAGTPPESNLQLMPKNFSDISWLSIGYTGGKGTVVLQLQNMKEPLSSLRRCTMSLLRSWGFDPGNPETMPAVPPMPRGDPGNWLSSADYPADDRRIGHSAVINFRLMIDANGKATACHVQSTTIGESFRNATCKLIMKRARFSPGLNAGGKPVASWYENSVRWVTPG